MPSHGTTLLLLALAAAVAGCDDLTPEVVDLAEAGGLRDDAGGAEASVDGGFDLAACQACFEAADKPGPGCGTEYRACEADMTCTKTIQCLSPCLGETLPSFVSCALPCSSEVGSVAGTSSYDLGMSFFECVAGSACSSVCFTK